MIALGLIGLLVAYVGLWSGFKGTDPRDEILAAFRGGTATPKLRVVSEEATPTERGATSVTTTVGVSPSIR